MTDGTTVNPTDTTPDTAPQSPRVVIDEALFKAMLEKCKQNLRAAYSDFVVKLAQIPAHANLFVIARQHFDVGYVMMKEAIECLPKDQLMQVPVAPTAPQAAPTAPTAQQEGSEQAA
jgi:hypothetical protein